MSDQVIMRSFGRKAHDFVMRPPEYDHKYTLAEGSVRSSKTFMMDAKTIVQLSRYKLPPNAKNIMTGATKQTFYRNVLLDLFAIVGQANYSYNSASGELWLFGKQWFVIGAKDEASYKQILGSTVGLWVGDEVVEYPKSFIAQMFTRMSPAGARAYLTTNPGNPYQYLKTDVIDDPAFEGRLEVLHFTLDDNPNIAEADKQDIISSQKGVFKLRYIDGLWVVAEGSIYRDSWDDELNTCGHTERVERINGRNIKIRAEPITLKNAGGFTDRWYSVDAGVDHPQVHLEYYDDGDVIYVTREQVWDSRIEMRQKTDGQYADDLEQFMGGRKHRVIVPPEAASFRAELILRGFWVTDADNAVSEGIHTVSTLLSRRKLVINRDGCPRLVKRIPTYAWDEKASKRGEEAPLKFEDDEPDALRYGVHGKVHPWRLRGK
jgi:PBSX family phage terminase large subunit